MEQNQLSPYVDWNGPANLFDLVEKDEDDQFKLLITEKEVISHDSYRIVLKFPNDEWIAGLWPGGHFKFHYQIDGQTVTKPYTPISLVNEKGSATFVIKVYRPCEEFPNGGQGTLHLENNLKVGDYLTVEGPIGKVRYYGNNNFALLKKALAHPKKKVGLIAGGSGLTPVLSIMAAAVLSKDDMDINFVYCNKTKNDILCKDLIDSYQGERCKINYTLTRHNDEQDGEWTGLRGRISSQLFTELGMPAPADDVFIFYCGPKGMNDTVRAILAELGYKEGEHYA